MGWMVAGPWTVLCAATLSALTPDVTQGQDTGRTLLYDEAHFNFSSERMSGLLDIGRSLGLQVRIGRAPLDGELANGPSLLVVCVPASIPDSAFVARFREPRAGREPDWAYWSPDYDRSPYSETELRAMVDWIRSGGRLLLILDHAPGPLHARALTRALGVDARNAFTSDRSHYPPGYAPPKPDTAINVVPTTSHWILFSRSTHTLGTHPILDGDVPARRVNAVATYTGSSLVGPAGSTPLLMLSDSALDVYRAWPDGTMLRIPARGRSQALAFTIGSGRVVVSAEAGVFQKSPFGSRSPDTGLDYAHADNRLYAENVLRWLLANP